MDGGSYTCKDNTCKVSHRVGLRKDTQGRWSPPPWVTRALNEVATPVKRGEMRGTAPPAGQAQGLLGEEISDLTTLGSQEGLLSGT